MVTIIRLSFTLFDRRFQPLWFDDGFLILGSVGGVPPKDIIWATAAYDELGGDRPLQPLPHPNPRDDDICLISILRQGVTGTVLHKFGQPIHSVIGPQLRRHNVHREPPRRAAEFVIYGGRTLLCAFVRSFSDCRRSTRLGIGFAGHGSCPLEGGHSDWVVEYDARPSNLFA